MANLSIREAVKYYQVSRPTLTKALKSGKITGSQDGQGRWSIDPSELARVYQARLSLPDQSMPDHAGQSGKILTTQDIPSSSEIERLRAHIAEVELRAAKAESRADAAEVLAKERAERIEDLRRMLPPPNEPQKQRRWWWQK